MGPSEDTWITTNYPFPFKQAINQAKTCKNLSKTSFLLDQVVNGTIGTQSSYTQEIHMKVGIGI